MTTETPKTGKTKEGRGETPVLLNDVLCAKAGDKNGFDIALHTGVTVGRFEYGDDGYLYYWPDTSRGGFWEAYVMREIANLLDHMNKVWEQKILDDIGA